MPEITRCARCPAASGGRNPNPATIRSYSVDGGPAQNLCDACRDVTAQYHRIAAVGAATSAGAGPGRWVHRGGGHYENTATGERRRGRP